MSFNQKAVLSITLLAAGITSAVTFVVFDPPYQTNFWIAYSALMLSEVLYGAFWIQQIGRKDAILPAALGVLGPNTAYFSFALLATLLTWLDVKYYVLLHSAGFAVFVIWHVFFRIAEHNIEEQTKNDEPETKIERAEVTWR